MNNDQKKVNEFVINNEMESSSEVRVLDLISEVGELAKEILKGNNYGKKHLELSEKWADELGDVYFSLICLANVTGVDLSVCLSKTLDKYKGRIERKNNPGSES